ncbi:MAG: TonB-dependent receptor [Caulobacteraceae bacterium]|nr:TonB-dependent receptor [Caulobacteraceae bacterium]
MNRTKTILFAAGASIATLAGPAFAQDAAPATQPVANVYPLGEIEVTARKIGDVNLGGAVVAAVELRKFNITTANQALNLIAGTDAAPTGGPRNEGVIYIHGFDRFETTLSIDGIRVYLPADNRLDFSRFLTEDLSEIQVAKGYVSVLDGPGGMGGAINLVTRKPTKPLEVELWGGGGFDRDGSVNSYDLSGLIGGRTDKYYLQLSGARSDISHDKLSNDYASTSVQPAGNRYHSYSNDWRINLKAGFTPNDTDEYSINYIEQDGAKGAPYNVYDSIATQRYWDWPVWDIRSVYALSHTKLGGNAYVDGKLYYNQFINDLFSYSNAAQTLMNTPKAFKSYYDDSAFGGRIELGANLTAADTLKAMFEFREDRHVQHETTFNPLFTQPDQTSVEDTYSVAIEDVFHATAHIDVVGGVSYDWRDLKQAQDYSNGVINYPLRNSNALNGQGAVTYAFDGGAKLYASVSDRTRFPTLFDRFSSRFGGAISNPGLLPERAVNYEVGGSTLITPRLKLDGAVFYSDVTDIIVSVPLIYQGTAVTQSRNVGSGKYYGAEASIHANLSPTVDVGANYTYIRRVVDNPATAGFELTGVPINKAFIYLDWRALPALTVTPSLDMASSRWTTNTAGTAYFKIGSYTLANLGLTWRMNSHVDVLAGVKNVFDRNYQLVYGFPEAGRTEYLSLHMHL